MQSIEPAEATYFYLKIYWLTDTHFLKLEIEWKYLIVNMHVYIFKKNDA